MFSYVSPEASVPADPAAAAIRVLASGARERLSGELDRLHAADGRNSIAPEKLLWASLLQASYPVGSVSVG